MNRVLAGVALSACVELAVSLGPRRWTRQRLWREARVRGLELDRPLVVIGAPGGGVINRIVGRDYGCGNLAIDIQPTHCRREMQMRAEDALPQLPRDCAVIYISCTLEYVDDVELVMAECRRIAGPHIFVADVEPWSLTAWFYPGAKRRVFVSPKGDGAPLIYKPLPWASHPKGSLAGLGGMRLFLPRRS